MTRPEAIIALGLVLVAAGLAALALPQLLAIGVLVGGLAILAYGIAKLRVSKDIWHTNETVGRGDGKTSAFRTSTPYVAGTLSAFVDGILQPPETMHPATGAFTFDWNPSHSSHISASWKEA